MTSAELLLSPEGAREAATLLGELDVDAWLLYDFGGQNPLAHRLLGVGKTTRPAFALIPRDGAPVLLRHRIEASPWRGWPWETHAYVGWREMRDELGGLLEGLRVVAMEVSRGGAVPTLDRVPSGVVELVRGTGVEVTSSADLITVFHARWPARGLELHRLAAETVRTTALAAFERAVDAAGKGAPLREAEVMDWIRLRLSDEGITDQVDCIVACGSHTSDPHYQPRDRGASLDSGSLVLIDLWGRHPGGIPADQTWMGFLGERAPDRVREIWSATAEARDAALDLLAERFERRQPVRGWEVDAAARATLARHGLDSYFIHRLGHSIDEDLHGSGPNLDDFETHDERRLLAGVGFSVEPGVYIPGELGVRTEVNVHWGVDGPEVTPREAQTELLLAPALFVAP